MNRPLKIIIPFRHYGENKLPIISGVREQVIFDWNVAEETLAATKVFGEKEIEEVYLPMVINDILGTYRHPANGYITNTELIEDMGIAIDLVAFEFPNEEKLLQWVDEYNTLCRDAIDEASGDDDFFDYVPDFVKGFEIVCEFSNLQLIWKEFCIWVSGNHHMFYEEHLIDEDEVKPEKNISKELLAQRNAFIQDVKQFIMGHEFMKGKNNDDISADSPAEGEEVFNIVVMDEEKITTSFLCLTISPE